MELLVFGILFIVLLVIGAPIYLCMIVPSIVYVLLVPEINMLTITSKLMESVNNFPLLAVPFFVFLGNLMNTTSVTDRIFNFANAVVGRYPGGLGYVNIVNSVIFSGMSGSAIADLAGPGQTELKAMKNAGYDDSFSVGVTAASSTIGPIIPPSIPFVIYAAFAGVSTGAMFIGGILPGLFMAFIIGIVVYIMSRRLNYPREAPVGFKGFIRAFMRSWAALLMPFIIIGGIWTGWFTATEAALVSIIYAMIIGIFIFRDIKIKSLYKIMLESLHTILPILAVLAGATLFSFILIYNSFNQIILNAMISITDSKYVVMLFIIIFCTILGMFMDGIVAILIIIPISITLCAHYGINPIHLGIIITVTNMIGLLTPPVGYSLYVFGAITKKPVMTIARYVFPWLIPLYITLFVMAMWEPICMWLPTALGFGK